jgi:hypothetical protein
VNPEKAILKPLTEARSLTLSRHRHRGVVHNDIIRKIMEPPFSEDVLQRGAKMPVELAFLVTTPSSREHSLDFAEKLHIS